MSSLKTALLNLIPDPMVIFFSRPYVAGNSMKAAIDLADKIYKEKGILSTIDVLGEEVQNEDDSKRALDLYLKTIDALGDRKYASVSFAHEIFARD